MKVQYRESIPLSYAGIHEQSYIIPTLRVPANKEEFIYQHQSAEPPFDDL